MLTGFGGFPKHMRQPYPWGCMNYSLFSLTGDERILDYAEECSDNRFAMQMFDLGYYFNVLWSNVFDNTPAGSQWWVDLEHAIRTDPETEEHGSVALLIDIPSPAFEGVLHTVAVWFQPKRDVWVVYDPGAREGQVFNFGEFLSSPYSQAVKIRLVTDAKLDVYPAQIGPEAAHVSPELRAKYYAQKFTCQ